MPTLFLAPFVTRLTRFESLWHILLVAFLRPILIVFTPELIVHLMTTGFGFAVRSASFTPRLPPISQGNVN